MGKHTEAFKDWVNRHVRGRNIPVIEGLDPRRQQQRQQQQRQQQRQQQQRQQQHGQQQGHSNTQSQQTYPTVQRRHQDPSNTEDLARVESSPGPNSGTQNRDVRRNEMAAVGTERREREMTPAQRRMAETRRQEERRQREAMREREARGAAERGDM